MKYFELEEFNCQHTGNNEMKPEFLEKLDQLRHNCGFPFVITSGSTFDGDSGEIL